MSEKMSFTVLPEQSGQRLDALLAGLTDLSRSRVAALMKDGMVTLNGSAAVKASAKAAEGDVLELTLPETRPVEVLPQDIPLDILYQDPDIAVINKPCGMVVHPAAGNEDGTLVNAVLYHIRDLSGIGGEMRPGIVHRLDKDTSGLILIAKNDRAHQSISEQFQNRTTEKHYRALVYGGVKEDEGRIEAAIARHPTDRKKMSVQADGKPAVSEWRVLERFRQATLLDVHILTGRTHQIRVHMKYAGHPLLGDVIYAPNLKTSVRIPRLMLHSYSLSVTHPSTGERMTFTAPLPEAFERTLEAMRKG